MREGAIRGASAVIASRCPFRAIASFRPHGREKDHITDVGGSREVHEKPVHAYAYTTHRRHAVLHGTKVVLVHADSLFVPGSLQAGLGLQSSSLVDRALQFPEGGCT